MSCECFYCVRPKEVHEDSGVRKAVAPESHLVKWLLKIRGTSTTFLTCLSATLGVPTPVFTCFSPNILLSVSQTVPFCGNVPSTKYARMALEVHCDAAAREEC